MARRAWRRPYSGGWYQAFLAALMVLGGVFVVAFLVAGGSRLADSRIGAGVGALVGGVVFGTVWLGFLSRLIGFGIYVGGRGLRYRGFFRTTEVAWSDVSGIRLAPPSLPWMPYESIGVLTIYIDRCGEKPLQTWVNNKGAGFIGRRRAFERAFAELRSEVEEHLAAENA